MIALMPAIFTKGAVGSGTTVPAAPGTGDMFLHTPTGRKVLLQYDGANWNAIISYGAMAIYVDKTDGTDAIDKGTGVDSDAFKTIQYAVDAIPGQVGGNVTVNINSETYSEDVVVQGKALTGNYTITFQGVLSSQESGTWSANGVTGTGATQGTGTDTGSFAGDSYANMLLLEGGDSVYRIIDSHNDNTLTIVGTFNSQPQSGETWEIFNWGTQMTPTDIAILVEDAQVGVVVNDIYFNGNDAVVVDPFGSATMNRCKVNSAATSPIETSQSALILEICFVNYTNNSTQRAIASNFGRVTVYRTKVYGGGNNNTGFRGIGGQAFIGKGTIFDNLDNSVTGAVWAEAGCGVTMFSAAADGFCRVRNCTTGLYARRVSAIFATGSVQYSGNGTNETADAGSFGYID